MSAQPERGSAPRITTTSFQALKDDGRRIVMVTAYDVPSARLAEEAGVDALLVGDSLGMTVLGHASTLPVTIDDMVRATAAVTRTATRVLVVADMPFGSYQASPEDAVRNATRLVAEGGAHAVKLEGAGSNSLAAIERLVEAGIPVMGHIGLTPQSVNVMGGYRIQGKSAAAAAALMAQAVLLQKAGAFAMVLEGIPAELGERITALVDIPTIGIGAGVGCDGEVQVFSDLLGLGGSAHMPRHARRYAEAGTFIRDALAAYAGDVRLGAFPTAENASKIDPEELAEAELAFGVWERVDGHARPGSADDAEAEADELRRQQAHHGSPRGDS